MILAMAVAVDVEKKEKKKKKNEYGERERGGVEYVRMWIDPSSSGQLLDATIK